MLMKNILTITLLLIFSSSLIAKEPQGIPEKLFGISLGGVYDLGEPVKNDLGDVPVKKCTAIVQFRSLKHPLSHAIVYYFKPEKEYKGFEYVEMHENPEDEMFRTSFSMTLLPVIPEGISTLEEFKKIELKWQVTAIEWSHKSEKEGDAYYWASNLCDVFKADISEKPEIHDSMKMYACTFSSGNREFEVHITAGTYKNVSLSYTIKAFDEKHEAVDQKIRKLQAEEIRPYE